MSYREGPKLNLNDLAFLQECLDTILASRQIDPASGQAEVAAASLFRAHLSGIVEKAELSALPILPMAFSHTGKAFRNSRRNGAMARVDPA